jgi:hypothetical protein
LSTEAFEIFDPKEARALLDELHADIQFRNGLLGCAPMIRFRLVVQVPDPRDEWSVAILFGPVDGFVLSFKSLQNMVGMVFDDVIVDGVAFRAAFGARLNVNIRHLSPS